MALFSKENDLHNTFNVLEGTHKVLKTIAWKHLTPVVILKSLSWRYIHYTDYSNSSPFVSSKCSTLRIVVFN